MKILLRKVCEAELDSNIDISTIDELKEVIKQLGVSSVVLSFNENNLSVSYTDNKHCWLPAVSEEY